MARFSVCSFRAITTTGEEDQLVRTTTKAALKYRPSDASPADDFVAAAAPVMDGLSEDTDVCSQEEVRGLGIGSAASEATQFTNCCIRGENTVS